VGGRAFFTLFFVLALLSGPLGVLSSILSKRVPSDVLMPFTALEGFERAVLEKSESFDFKFTAQHPGDGTRRRCPAWYSSEVGPVYYQVNKGFHSSLQGIQWQVSTGNDSFWGGTRSTNRYRFVRPGPRPLEVVFNGNSPFPRCGRLGSPASLPEEITPLDVLTDLLGFDRFQSYLVARAAPRPSGGGTPSVVATPASRALREPKPSTSLFAPLQPRPKASAGSSNSARAANRPVEQASAVPGYSYWRDLLAKQSGYGDVQLDQRHWRYVDQRLKELSMWRGDRKSSLQAWQRAHSDIVKRSLTVRETLRLMTPVKLNASGLPVQWLKLKQTEWAWVQQQLNRRGYRAGAVDGIVGAQTVAAIRAFQRANGRVPSGVLNRKDIKLLR